MELLNSLMPMNLLKFKLVFRITSTLEFFYAGCTVFQLVNFAV